MTENKLAKPTDRLKAVLSAASVQDQLQQTLGENKEAFVASLLDLYGSDNNLQRCAPGAVVKEAFKAAALNLPIAKSLGFAWIIPYKNVPQFQLGYKGIIQLAQRTGRYRFINAGVVRQGETPIVDKVTGSLSITGEPDSPDAPPLGYFAYIETVDGFKKAEYWTLAQIESHRDKFCKSKKDGKVIGPWADNFDAMALKTCLKSLIGRYGPMTTALSRALSDESQSPESRLEDHYEYEAEEIIDIESEEVEEVEEEASPKATDKELEMISEAIDKAGISQKDGWQMILNKLGIDADAVTSAHVKAITKLFKEPVK